MKKSILSFGLAFMSMIGLFAQSPDGFKYQAVLRDDASNILHDQPVGIQIEILSGDINGMVVYSETFDMSTNDYGLVNMEIGKGQTPDDFAAIDWSAGNHFIRISVDPEGGAAYEEMGTSQL
ncbi:MAG: collagen-like protein, partial [Cryomorphaceae bacterium]